LARAMVSLGNACKVRTRALLSNMDAPLGRAAGNWLEVKEAVACLEGKGPDDLQKLVVECAAHLLVQTRKTDSLNKARGLAAKCLAGGEPREKWNEMLKAQGAALAAFERKLKLDSTAPVAFELTTPRAGYVSRCDARIIGELIRDLGGGRLTKDSRLNYDVGIDQLRKPGEHVERGAVLARVHAASVAQAKAALERLCAAFQISARKPRLRPPIAGMITKG